LAETGYRVDRRRFAAYCCSRNDGETPCCNGAAATTKTAGPRRPFLKGRSGDPAGRPRGSENRPRTGIAPVSAAVNFLQKNSENSRAAGEGQARP
jgi:hypothetical protein